MSSLLSPKQLSNYAYLVIATLGISALWLAMRGMVGLSADSTVYLGAARCLLQGQGVSGLSGNGIPVPMTIHAPYFSMFLAMMSWLIGTEPLSTAKWVQTGLFGANIVLVGVLLRMQTKSLWISLMGAFLILTSPDVITIHLMAWSEPLYLFLSLGGIALLAFYFENRRESLFYAAAATVSLAFLTRYAGISLVAVAALSVFMFHSANQWHLRFKAAFLFAVLSALPATLWMIRSHLVSDQTIRGLGIHWISWSSLEGGMGTLLSWFLPFKIGTDLVAYTFIGICLVLFLVRRLALLQSGPSEGTERPQNASKLDWMLKGYCVSYFGLMVGMISFLDVTMGMNLRLMTPLYIVSVLLLGLWVAKVSRQGGWLRPILWTFMVLLCLSQATRAVFRFQEGHEGNHINNYAAKQWKDSDIIKEVKQIPEGRPILTNAYDVVYALTGRPAFEFPAKTIPHSWKEDKRYESRVSQMADLMRKRDGAVVYFKTMRFKTYLPTDEDLKKLVPLEAIKYVKDGTVYKIR